MTPLAAIMKSSIKIARAANGHGLEIADAIALHHRPHFRAIEIESALGLPIRAQRLRDPVLLAQLRLEPVDPRERGRRRAPAFEPRAHFVVRQLRSIAHHRPIDVGLADEAGGIDVELNHDRGAIDIWQQRRLVGRQRLGKHREDARGRVDGRRVRLRVTVDRIALRHEGVDVCDCHQHPRRRAAVTVADFELIQIARLVVVDGRPRQIAQVSHAVRRGGARGARFGQGSRWEVGLEPVLLHRAARDGFEKSCGRTWVKVYGSMGPWGHDLWTYGPR